MSNVIYAIVITVSILSNLHAIKAKAAEKISPVLVAFDHSPPYSWNENGEAKGQLVELMEKLLGTVGLEMKPVFCPWARCMSLIQSGEVDVIPGVSFTEERAEFFSSSSPFSFYILNNAKDIKTKRDLTGLSIGKLRGSLIYEELGSNQNISFFEGPDIASLINMLLAGRIDTFVYIQETADEVIKELGYEKRIVVSSLVHNQELKGYLGLSKASEFMAYENNLTEVLTKLKSSGEIDRLLHLETVSP